MFHFHSEQARNNAWTSAVDEMYCCGQASRLEGFSCSSWRYSGPDQSQSLIVWLRNGDDTHIPWELVLRVVLLFCSFLYSNQGAVIVCTSQHEHSGTAE